MSLVVHNGIVRADLGRLSYSLTRTYRNLLLHIGICEFCASYRKSPLPITEYELYEFSCAEMADPDLVGFIFMGQQACILNPQ